MKLIPWLADRPHVRGVLALGVFSVVATVASSRLISRAFPRAPLIPNDPPDVSIVEVRGHEIVVLHERTGHLAALHVEEVCSGCAAGSDK